MTLPLVSVLMTVYNGEKYLHEAIVSILSQTYSNLELVVVDDGSNDRSIDILEEFQRLDTRVIVYKHPKNMGCVAAGNSCFSLAQGKYVARLDADDVSVPERLERQVAFLEMHPDVGLVGSLGEMINGDGSHIMDISLPISSGLIMWSLSFIDPIINSASCARRSLVLQAGGYRSLLAEGEKGFPEDYDLWVRMICQSKLYNLPERLVKYRLHGASLSDTYMSLYLKNGKTVGHSHIKFILGREIPLEYVGVFWKERGLKKHLRPALELLDELLRKVIESTI